MGPKDYRCPFCSQKTEKNNKMQRHIRTHTGEKPYECPTCEKRFARKETCNAHFRKMIC